MTQVPNWSAPVLSASGEVDAKTLAGAPFNPPWTRFFTELAAMAQSGIGVKWFGSPTSLPNGWILCDGSLYSTSQFQQLFNVVQYTYGGAGDQFAVPPAIPGETWMIKT